VYVYVVRKLVHIKEDYTFAGNNIIKDFFK